MTIIPNDGVELRVVRDGDREDASPVVEVLERSFLPRPSTLAIPGKREKSVAGWQDPAIAAALAKETAFEIKGDGVLVSFFRRHSGVSLTVQFRLGRPASEIRALFLDLVEALGATYGRVRLINHGREIHTKHYASALRTFHADGLWWLNFFGPDEEARQGGNALASNPHARTERVPGGLLLEVGSSPEEETTPEGEVKLVEATRAMPPLPTAEPTAVAASVEGASNHGSDAASGGIEGEPRTIEGIRGFFDPGTGKFWVPRTTPPGTSIDARTVAKLAALRGREDVREVLALFSFEESARANEPALRAAGIRVWYISTETGQPSEV